MLRSDPALSFPSCSLFPAPFRDENLPSIFQKLVSNNISCVPVLDNRRRYMGLLDNQSLVIHALHAFGVLDPSERAATLQQLTAASAAISGPITSKADAEMKMEEAAAAGPQEGAQAIRAMAPPVHVKGGGMELTFAGRSVLRSASAQLRASS